MQDRVGRAYRLTEIFRSSLCTFVVVQSQGHSTVIPPMNLAKQAGIADWNTHLLPLESTTQICFIHMFGFASPETRFGQYEKLYPGHKDEDSAGNRLRNNSDEADGPGTSSEMSLGRRSTDAFQRLLPVLIGMNVLLSAALLCVVIVVARRPAPQLRSDVQFVGQAEVPVEMELYRFATGVREKTAFWGAPNATTDAAWSTILDGEYPHTRSNREQSIHTHS